MAEPLSYDDGGFGGRSIGDCSLRHKLPLKIYKVKDTMRCNICDRKMTDKEIVYNEELGAFEPCSTCLEVIMDAAFSGGYQDTGDESVILVGEQSFGEGDDLGEVSFKDLTGHQRSLVYNMSDGDND